MSTLKSLVLSLSALALTATLGCSNSSGGGGGGGAAKPNLTAAAQVGQSFSVIQSAGRSPSFTLEAISAAASVPQDKVRAQKLQKMISSPQTCQVSFKDNSGSNGRGGYDPNGDITFGFSLQISGNKCPLNASFTQDIRQSQSGNFQMQLDMGFKTKDDQAKQVVSATDAQVRGKAAFGPSADGRSITGKGQFLGYVNTVQYGRVNLETKLSMNVQVAQDGSQSGIATEETSFKFDDPSLNVVLTRTTTANGKTQTVTYTANGAAITEQEYNEVLGGMGMGTSSGGSNQTEQPSDNQPAPQPQPRDPRERN